MTLATIANRRPLLMASAVVAALTVFVTWPQALRLHSIVAGHQDPYFSMWRLAWIAHALRSHPTHLFDTNIFYPTARTLAFSDATLLEGALGAPLSWLGAPLVVLYNLMLLGGIVGSGVGMFVLARQLTHNMGAALVAAAVFTLVPYRIEHAMHLELQWTMWMPLAFWAVHRAVEDLSWRFGVLTGVLLWLQTLSCVYYGVFLAMTLPLLAGCLVLGDPRRAAAAIGPLLAGGAVAAVLTIPYAVPYAENARVLGPRPLDQVATFSARFLSYATAPYTNWIWGWTGNRFTGEELRLLPGIASSALAVVGATRRPRRLAWTYLAICAFAVELSRGLNSLVYSWAATHVPLLDGLRAPARFSIVAFCALAVLAGLGIDRLQELPVSVRKREWIAAAALILVALESGSAPMRLIDVPRGVPEVYVSIRQSRGVVVELPMPKRETPPGLDPLYVFWSTTHWQPLVNGYSGYIPREYLDTLSKMATFPDDESIARLRTLDVRYILVHQDLYRPADFTDLMVRMAQRRELRPSGQFRDWAGNTQVFLMNQGNTP
jgi:hypothetical protein